MSRGLARDGTFRTFALEAISRVIFTTNKDCMYISMFHRICLTVAVVTYNDMIIECSPIFGQGTQCIHLPIRSRKLKVTENSASQPLLVIVLAHKYNSLSRLCKTYLRSCNEYKGQGQS